MKKLSKLGLTTTMSIFILISCKSVQFQSETSHNALDWEGIYANVIPCPDCEGIQTTIVLNKNMTYTKSWRYVGKEMNFTREEGTFSWNKAGNEITLNNVDKKQNAIRYFVGENKLTQLDMDGKPIEESIRNRYTMEKVSNIIGKRWNLIELNGTEINPDEQGKAYFILHVEDNRINGNGSCNSFNGVYTLNNGNRISFSPMASTMMACMNMEIEMQLFKIMGMIDNYTINGNILSLNKARMAPLAKFVLSE